MRSARAMLFAGGIAAVTVATLLLTARAGEPDRRPIRIGTYDSRAVAIAYASGPHSLVIAKMERYKAAEAEGDQKTIDELEAWGPRYQRRLHLQGFGHYPVDDHLALVADRLPALAEKHDLDAIVWLDHFHGANVEVVDITRDLAMLFEPRGESLESIEQIRARDPIDLDTLLEMDHGE